MVVDCLLGIMENVVGKLLGGVEGSLMEGIVDSNDRGELAVSYNR